MGISFLADQAKLEEIMKIGISTILMLVLATSYVQAGTWIYSEAETDHQRLRRSPDHPPIHHSAGPFHSHPGHVVHHQPHVAHHQPAYAPAPHKGHHINPIYTFVKTDPHANFKWGVRHLAGAQYGK